MIRGDATADGANTATGSGPRDRAPRTRRRATRLAPDRALVRRLLDGGGDALRQCMQCATCSAVCELTPEDAPFPRKEMLWAQWGLADRLLVDVDLWLCHECHDCTVRCPRDARPGDVMAALRQECVSHYSWPRGLARWAARPGGLVGLVVGAAALLAAAAWGWEAAGATAAELAGTGLPDAGPRIVIPFSPRLPHGLLGVLFATLLLLDGALLGLGAARYWRALVRANRSGGQTRAPTSWGRSLRLALGRVAWHEDFGRCQTERGRRVGHSLVLYGMLGLVLVDLWVVTARYSPLRTGLVYPLGLTDPWKILANLAGAALVLGCVTMAVERWGRPARWFPGGQTAAPSRPRSAPSGTYGDWLLLALLLTVALTGFVTEALHFARMEPTRHLAYLVHLVSVVTLLLVLPYTKLAHLAYRTVAFVYVERHGLRRRRAGPAAPAPSPSPAAATLAPREVP